MHTVCSSLCNTTWRSTAKHHSKLALGPGLGGAQPCKTPLCRLAAALRVLLKLTVTHFFPWHEQAGLIQLWVRCASVSSRKPLRVLWLVRRIWLVARAGRSAVSKRVTGTQSLSTNPTCCLGVQEPGNFENKHACPGPVVWDITESIPWLAVL